MTSARLSRSRRLLVTGALAASLLGTGLATSTHEARGAVPAASSSNTLSIGWTIETKTLDPAGKTENPDIWVQVNVYDRLVSVGKDGKTIKPDLATSWNITKGGKVYTFHLRPGIKFHDGSPVTAKDVVFCINRARQKARLWAWTLTAIKNV
jgi:peptide/nickel transport system substrate-binding protein